MVFVLKITIFECIRLHCIFSSSFLKVCFQWWLTSSCVFAHKSVRGLSFSYMWPPMFVGWITFLQAEPCTIAFSQVTLYKSARESPSKCVFIYLPKCVEWLCCLTYFSQQCERDAFSFILHPKCVEGCFIIPNSGLVNSNPLSDVREFIFQKEEVCHRPQPYLSIPL